MMKSWLAALLTACILPACGGGGDPSPSTFPSTTQAAIDKIVTDYLAARNIPGAVVAVSIPRQGEMTMAYGVANLSTRAPRTTTDPFRIASITKTFIGTLILQLVDDGSVALDDKIMKWYPEFPNGDRVTVDHLLRMRSGIPDAVGVEFLKEFYANPLKTPTPSEIIARAAARASEFGPPDTVTLYNNTNYVMLGEIARQVARQELQPLLTERIFRPLGMTDSLYPSGTALGGSTRGYLFDPTTRRFKDLTELDPSAAGGAGAMISTLADLKTYARALCKGTLLKPETQARRLQGTTLDGEPEFVQYGRGIEKLGRFCGHNGTIFGFSSEMFYLPEEDAMVVVNVNRLDLDDHSQSSELFLLLTRLLFPQYVNW